METIALALHVTAAAVLVGPQVLMLVAVVPASWLIEDDERLKRALLRAVATRFGVLAVIALGTLLATGLYQYFAIVPQAIREQPASYRFGALFMAKMALFVVLLAAIGAHTFIFSRRIGRLSDAVIAGESEGEGGGDVRALERARRRSFTFSAAILALSLVLLWLGVALGNHEFSWSAP